MTENQIIHEMFCLGMTIDEIAAHKSLHPSHVRKIVSRQEEQERKKWERQREQWNQARGQAWKACFGKSWETAVRRLRHDSI